MKRYEPKVIEPKWQQAWKDSKVYEADLESSKPKYIGMSMFNYPSGAGLHIGHAMNYTISDVIARAKRQQGFESYHPVGWDSFGLPAENYAIKAGVSPQQSMATIIPNYQKQYQAMGWSNDWSKEIATHEPEYYKWTQWIFSQMHRAGLAYQDARLQWWCDGCQTVLANEQVLDGKCWRHDSAEDPEVTQKEVPQWFFKITDYADELLEATDALDWTEHVKTAQKNWIGRSEGAEISYKISAESRATSHESRIATFTMAHDTIYGTTFLVLAPEHELVSELTTNEYKVEVEIYVKAAKKKSAVERMADKSKSGVFTGAYAINPINDKKIPIWVAEYVLAEYGTGAVMGVPGEDGRDFEFAQKYDLEVIYTTDKQEFVEYHETIKLDPAAYVVANSDEFDGMTFKEARPKILNKLIEMGAAVPKVNYKMKDWSVSRQRYWGAPIPIVHCQAECGSVLLPDDQLPVVLPELEDFQPSGDGKSALARATEWLKTTCPNCGGPAERETDTLDTYICSSWYMLRYMDPHNAEVAFSPERVNKWTPIDFYNGADHATAHMLYARFIARYFHKKGVLSDPEPFKKFLLNGKLMAQNGQMFSKSKGNGIDPLEIIDSGYGADALRMYLMFAAPLDQWVKWDPNGVPGTFRFINRVWDLVQSYVESAKDAKDTPDTELLKASHKAIAKVTKDIDEQKYNTAIASLMSLQKTLSSLSDKHGFSASNAWAFACTSLVSLLAPFAPHAADELWQDLGNDGSVQKDSWPVLDEKYLVDDQITVVVQINGKVRAQLNVELDTDKDVLMELAKKDSTVAKYLNGQEIKKTIVVPNKIVNFVV